MRGEERDDAGRQDASIASSLRTLATRTPRGQVYIYWPAANYHEAADKSRIPDPVQFYIYRRRGVCGEEHGHADSLSPRLSFIIPHLCSNRVPRFSRRCSFPSFSRSRKEKQRKRVTEREGCPLSKGWRRGTAAVVMRLCERARWEVGCVYVEREEGAIMCVCVCT